MDFPREKRKTVNKRMIIKLVQGFKLFLTFIYFEYNTCNVLKVFTMIFW